MCTIGHVEWYEQMNATRNDGVVCCMLMVECIELQNCHQSKCINQASECVDGLYVCTCMCILHSTQLIPLLHSSPWRGRLLYFVCVWTRWTGTGRDQGPGTRDQGPGPQLRYGCIQNSTSDVSTYSILHHHF